MKLNKLRKRKFIIFTTLLVIFLIATGPSLQTRIISGPNLELKNTGSNFVLFAETTGD